MRLAHALLYFLRVCVHDELRALRQAEEHPAALEDVRNRQEIHHAVVLADGHALVVGYHRSVVLTVGEHHALRVAGRSARVQNVGKVVLVGLAPQFFHLALPRQVVAQLQEVVEVDGTGVALGNVHRAVEDNDLLQSRALRQHTERLVVLFLLSHEEEANLRVADHVLYLLLAARGVERNGDGPDAESAEVGTDVLHRVLREHAHVLLNAYAQVQHGIAYAQDNLRELVPRHGLPLQTAKVAIVHDHSVAVLLRLFMRQHREMTSCLHNPNPSIYQCKVNKSFRNGKF